MTNMLLSALENAFDEYCRKNNKLSAVGSLTDYREELNRFAQFLVNAFEEHNESVNYWEDRFTSKD